MFFKTVDWKLQNKQVHDVVITKQKPLPIREIIMDSLLIAAEKLE